MKLLLALVFSAAAYGLQAQQSWSLDKSHSNVRFTATHMVISEVDGHFNDFEASLTTNRDDFANSDVNFTAQTGSIDTGNERRDGHLKSDDFFNAEKYPEMTFEGKLLKEGEDYRLAGDLTIRDVTKQVSFDVKYFGKVNTGKGEKAGFKISGTISRFDYNLKWDNKIQNGSYVVSDEIDITANIQLNSPEG